MNRGEPIAQQRGQAHQGRQQHQGAGQAVEPELGYMAVAAAGLVSYAERAQANRQRRRWPRHQH